jgi:hypothetical protein
MGCVGTVKFNVPSLAFPASTSLGFKHPLEAIDEQLSKLFSELHGIALLGMCLVIAGLLGIPIIAAVEVAPIFLAV